MIIYIYKYIYFLPMILDKRNSIERQQQQEEEEEEEEEVSFEDLIMQANKDINDEKLRTKNSEMEK